MYEQEEKRLSEVRARLEQVPLPLDKADRAIFLGMERAKKEKWSSPRKWTSDWFPRFLTVAFTLGFLSIGGYMVNEQLEEASEQPDIALPAEGENAAELPAEKKEGAAASLVELNHSLPEDTLIKVTEEFKGNLSIPLDLKALLPSENKAPEIEALTLKQGYRTTLMYTHYNGLRIIETVIPPKEIASYQKTREKFWEDEQETQIEGNPAFYSDEFNELMIYTEERVYALNGAEMAILFEVANLIDMDKPLRQVEIRSE